MFEVVHVGGAGLNSQAGILDECLVGEEDSCAVVAVEELPGEMEDQEGGGAVVAAASVFAVAPESAEALV